MLEAVLSFVTPGALTLPNRFSWRVLTSWITCGWVLGIVFAICSIFQPSAGVEASTVLFAVVVGFPFAVCFYGFLGLVVDLARGNKLVYSGWYWYAYPWVTAFWIVILLILFFIALAGIKFPAANSDKPRRFTYKQLQKELPSMKAKDFMEDFKKEITQLEKSNKLDFEEKKILVKLKELDISELRNDLKDALSEDELKTLFKIFIYILELLGIEVI
jgi:hypothetical protein